MESAASEKDTRASHGIPGAIPARSTPAAVKSQGRLDFEFAVRDGSSFVASEYQSGCLRARQLTRATTVDLTVVSINTAGGLTGGDELVQNMGWRQASRAIVTTPAAEKIYRSAGETARSSVRLKVEAGARAEWLPQETILFEGARLERSVDVHLSRDAELVMCDGTVFGRLACAESITRASFADTLSIFREGEPLLFDRTTVDGNLHDWLDRKSTGRGARAVGMILIACSAPCERLAAVRDALDKAQGLAGATIVRGLVYARFLAASDVELRHDLAAALGAAREGRPLPRNWSI